MDFKDATVTGTNIYEKFLGFLIKKGNKFKAKRSLDLTFSILLRLTKISKHTALIMIFSKLNSFVEVKKVRVRRRFVLVPFPICWKRRAYLIVKWVMQSAKKNIRKKSFSFKLSLELFRILNDSSLSKTKQLRQSNFSAALSNRSNTHFRW